MTGAGGIIHHLCVHPDFRRSGIAGRLVTKAEEALKEEGIQKVFGLVFTDNGAANAFWEKQGAIPSAAYPDGRAKWTEESLEGSLPAAEYNVGFRYTPYKNILDRIREAGGEACTAMPFLPPYPQSLEAILDRVKALCGEPGKKVHLCLLE